MRSSRRTSPVVLRLPFSARSVGVARRRLQTWMLERGDSPELVEDARMVISELVGNSVRHASPLDDGKILVEWVPGADSVELTVTDGGGTTQPRTVEVSTSVSSGRGMAIVEVLAQRWWTEGTTSRSTVHAVLHV